MQCRALMSKIGDVRKVKHCSHPYNLPDGLAERPLSKLSAQLYRHGWSNQPTPRAKLWRQSLVFQGALPTLCVLAVLGLNQLVRHITPSALRHLGVRRGQVCLGDMEGKPRGLLRVIPRVKQSDGLGFVFGAQAVLSASFAVFTEVIAVVLFKQPVRQFSFDLPFKTGKSNCSNFVSPQWPSKTQYTPS